MQFLVGTVAVSVHYLDRANYVFTCMLAWLGKQIHNLLCSKQTEFPACFKAHSSKQHCGGARLWLST